MKKTIRKEIINERKALSKSQVIEKSKLIFERLNKMNLLEVENTLLYMDFRNEVMTKDIINHIIGKVGSVLLPRVEGSSLTIHRVYNLQDMVLSPLGILEPKDGHNLEDYKTIDQILAPGVAFDKKCYRLGYGGGFYDRLLSQKRREVPVIALAFDLQIIDQVPTEPHDYKMDMIITESQIIKSK